MEKNVVLCCDGTANEFAKNNTNVVKLFSVLTQDPDRQVCYYHPGLGTMEPAGALTTFSRRITTLFGKAIGYGLEDDIRDAYVFIMNHYLPGDRLFLFGFSRGAYTARAVCSLLHMYGLLRPGNEPLVRYAIRMMMGIERGLGKQREVREYFELARKFKAAMSLDCKPYFVGCGTPFRPWVGSRTRFVCPTAPIILTSKSAGMRFRLTRGAHFFVLTSGTRRRRNPRPVLAI